MIKCEKCGRENDANFHFCLDCGQDLRPMTRAAPAQNPTPPATPRPGAGAGAAPRAAASTAAATNSQPPPNPPPPPSVQEATAAPAAEKCPKCGGAIRSESLFCSLCGHRLAEDAAGKGRTLFMHAVGTEEPKKRRARLILIKPDGTEGTVFTMAPDKTLIGRNQGIVQFPKDPYVSPRHAELHFEDGKLTVVDLDSLNGVYRRMSEEMPIYPGTYFRIGRQLLRIEVPTELLPVEVLAPAGDDSVFWGSPEPQIWARLLQVLEGGKVGEIHFLTKPEILIGREDGEVRYPDDGFISSRHCLAVNRDGDCFLRDVGSSNGTYLRIEKSQELKHNDRIQIGNQVLRVDLT